MPARPFADSRRAGPPRLARFISVGPIGQDAKKGSTGVIELSQDNLGRLGPNIAIPRYDRSSLRCGIVHFGLGNFHRVHQAVYVDRCLHDSSVKDWGRCGVELIDSPAARAKGEAYKRQDYLFTVTEFEPDGKAATRVVGAMIDYIHAPADPEALLQRLTGPDTRIVSLTITEGGYNLDETTGNFKFTSPDVAHDLAGGPCRTAFGFIVEALRRRRDTGTGPFTVMSCDNLRHNGDTAKKAILSFAEARDPVLAAWIETNVAFPNSMVDRIAPQVSPEARDRLNVRSGVDDAVPAIGETFSQWVIEDRFSAGRPALETVGVELRDDVAVFEFMKGRMLNASHVMLAYPALLCGYRIVHEAMGDKRLATLLRSFLDHDVILRLQGPPGVSLEAYRDSVLERFENPAINDQLLRIAFDGAAKFPVFHSKTIASLVESKGDLDREAYLLACYGRYLHGRDDKGQTFEVVEPRLSEADWALVRGGDPLGLLRTSPFESLGLFDDAGFVAAYRRFSDAIARTSASQALDQLLG
jgi:mannitol 2-dehydrogenase/sorbose reductase